MIDPARRREHIERALRERLDATFVEVQDESHLHAGHEGAKSGGGHFRALIVASCFEGESPVARQRRVYAAMARELESDIHALSLRTLTPAQWEAARRSDQ